MRDSGGSGMEAKNQTTPKCSIAEDLALLERYQHGDEQALVALLETHMGLIDFWARQISAKVPRAELDDLKHEGIVGFMKAAKKFDCLRIGGFHAYARQYVLGEILSSPEVKRVRRYQYRQYCQVRQAHDRLMEAHERRPTPEEISDETGLSVKTVVHCLSTPLFPEPLEEQNDFGAPEDPLTILLEQHEHGLKQRRNRQLHDALGQLKPNDAELIICHYFFNETDREIATRLDRSAAAIKTARLRAQEKLRKLILDGGGEKDGTSRY